MTDKKSQDPRVSLIIGEATCKRMRWVMGDRVSLVQDGDSIGVKRSNSGYTLTTASGKLTPAMKGKPMKCRVNFPVENTVVIKLLGLTQK